MINIVNKVVLDNHLTNMKLPLQKVKHKHNYQKETILLIVIMNKINLYLN